jgi:hypothetical protein
MSHITLGYSLSYKNTRTCFVLWVQSWTAQLVSEFFYEIVLRPIILIEPSKLQYIKERRMTIDMCSFDGCADGRWLTVFDKAGRQELTFPSACLQPVGPPERVLPILQSTFKLGGKLPAELNPGNTTCFKNWRNHQASLVWLYNNRESLYYQ